MIKSILVPVTGDVLDEDVLETALRVAQLAAAHIELCYFRTPSWEMAETAQQTAWAIGDAVAPALLQLEARIEQQTAKVRVRFVEISRRKGAALVDQPGTTTSVSASWYDAEEQIAELSCHARHADLVVVGRPRRSNGLNRSHIDKVLCEGGRPLLIAASLARSCINGTVFVCWKESAEAARALNAALPFLDMAQRVVVAHVAEGTEPKSLSPVASYLARHEIPAEIRLLPRRGSVADTLAAAADAHQADLIVLGAYGHSMARERVFGGCTRSFVDGARVPVLMMR